MLIQVTNQLKVGLITEQDHVFTDGTIFKFLDHVICEISPPYTASTPFFSVWHNWILYGRNPTILVSLFNDVSDMLNCWDACRVEAVG